MIPCKKIARGLLAAVLAGALCFQLLPNINAASMEEAEYDFREDALPASSDYAGAAAQEDMLLDMMNSVTNEPGAVTRITYAPEVPYENAYRTVSFNSPKEFYALLQKDDVAASLQAHEKHGWFFPIVDGERCAFGTIAVIDGEYYPSSGGWEPIEGSAYEFIARPETLEEILQNGQIENAETVIACHLPTMGACFVYVEKGEQQYIVPFAAEFSLPGVNDKQLNTLERVKQAFAQQIADHQQMIEDMKAQGATGPFVGGVGAGEEPAQPAAEGGQNTALIVGLSCAAALLALAAVALPVGYRLRRRKRERATSENDE